MKEELTTEESADCLLLRGCDLFDSASPRPQSVGCVKRTIRYKLWCVSRTLQKITTSESSSRHLSLTPDP